MTTIEKFYEGKVSEIDKRTQEVVNLVHGKAREVNYSSLDGMANARAYYMISAVAYYIRYGGNMPKELGGDNVSV